MEPRSTPGIRSGALRRRLGTHASGEKQPSLEDLRRLIFGPELARLDRLEERPVPTVDTVGGVLPEAVVRSTERRHEELAIALEPVVTAAVRSYASHNPDFFGEILAPTIGAAVRKAVRDAIASMLRRFNEALERSLSIRSVRWRIEARRTKRPLAEVILLRTLVYSVDEVFLIHSSTGLVLQRVFREDGGVQEPDQVASMLEAIESFAREALRPQPPGVHLTHVEVGDLTILVDRGALLTVAAVVRGVAPRELGELLREARERIQLAHQTELEHFQSDVSPFDAARPLLARCLRMERLAPPRRAQVWLAIAAALIVVVAGGLIAHGRVRAGQDARLLRTYVETLQAEPGIVVTSAKREEGRVRVIGFRDPLARAPRDVLAGRGLSPPELRFEPFYSLDPRLIERRIRQSLNPPSSVTLTLRDGTLRSTGIAPHLWIERTRLLASALPGIMRYDEQALHAYEAIEALRTAIAVLESTEIRFSRGSSEITAGTAMVPARSRFQQVIATANEARLDICVAVIGRADPTGSEDTNRSLSEARAIRVARELGARDTRTERLRAVGAGVAQDATTPAQARSVTFQVDIGRSCLEEP